MCCKPERICADEGAALDDSSSHWDAPRWRGRSRPSLRSGEAHRASAALAPHEQTHPRSPAYSRL